MPSKKCPCGTSKRYCAVCDAFSWWPPHIAKPEPGSADAARRNGERASWLIDNCIPGEEYRRLEQARAEAKEKAKTERQSAEGVRAARERTMSSTYRSKIKKGHIKTARLATLQKHDAEDLAREHGVRII